MAGTHAHRHRRYALTVIGLVVALLAVVNIAAYSGDLAWDATYNHRFSISDGTVKILKGLRKPMHLKYIISQDRPRALAGLQYEVENRLKTLADAVGDRFNFIPERDVIEVEDTVAMLDTIRNRYGISANAYRTEASDQPYFSAFYITYPDYPEPVRLSQILKSANVEYQLASLAVRLRNYRKKPAMSDDVFRRLKNSLRLVYLYDDPDDELKPIPELTGQPDRIAAELSRITTLSDGKVTYTWSLARDSDPRMRNLIQSTGQQFERPGGTVSLRYYSSIVLFGENDAFRVINGIKGVEGLANRIAQLAWDLEQPRTRVGVYTPSRRSELSSFELPTSGTALPPEAMVRKLVERSFGYEVADARINQTREIPRDLGALVLVRPCDLSERQRWEIERYLAAGGRVVAFVGDWHIPLHDSGQTFDKDTGTRIGESTDRVDARRVTSSLTPSLAKYGVEFEPGIILGSGGRDSISYRLLRADQRPQVAGKLELIPYARQTDQPHPLVSDVVALPLRGSSPIKLNETKLAKLGLEAEVILQTPPQARLLQLDPTRSTQTLNYNANSRSPIADIVSPDDNDGTVLPNLTPAGGKPVAVVLRGRFPFDASTPPPPFGENDMSAVPPGSAFKAKEGVLVLVSSPDLFELYDYQGRSKRDIGVVGGVDQLPQGSARKLLTNALDYLVFGKELIDVRRTLLPAPRKLEAWSRSQVRVWTLANIGLIPLLVAGMGLILSDRRRRRRGALENQRA